MFSPVTKWADVVLTPAPLNLNIPRPEEPSAPQIERATRVLNGARRPVVLAGHGAARVVRLTGRSRAGQAEAWHR